MVVKKGKRDPRGRKAGTPGKLVKIPGRDDLSKIQELYVTLGKTLKEIAKIYGTTHQNINQHLTKQGVEKRKPGIHKRK